MLYWNWKLVRNGVIRFGIMLLCFSLILHNLLLLNNNFLPQLPVGYILLFVLGIFIIRHVYRTAVWYSKWLSQKRQSMKYENIIIHLCVYLVVASIALSLPTSLHLLEDNTKVLNTSVINNNMQNVQNEHKTYGSASGDGYKVDIVDVITNVSEFDNYPLSDTHDTNISCSVIKFRVTNTEAKTIYNLMVGSSLVNNNGNEYQNLDGFFLSNHVYAYSPNFDPKQAVAPTAACDYCIPFKVYAKGMKLVINVQYDKDGAYHQDTSVIPLT